MSLIGLLRHIAPRYSRLSKNEVSILATMTMIESGNAYNAWKASGLKHYPTVLRTLKKLEEKHLVEVLSENGIRGERIYAPTDFGILLHYALKDNKTKITEIISAKSSRFRKLLKSKVEHISWIDTIFYHMAVDAKEGKSRTLDEVFEDAVHWFLGDRLLELQEDWERQRSKNKIIKLTKVEWMREFTLAHIESEIERCRKYVQELRKLKETLTAKNTGTIVSSSRAEYSEE